MIRKLRIAVDHGNKNMKTCNQVFTTALITQDKKPARGEEYIFYEGKYYLLSNRRIPYQRDKTEDERFFVLEEISADCPGRRIADQFANRITAKTFCGFV